MSAPKKYKYTPRPDFKTPLAKRPATRLPPMKPSSSTESIASCDSEGSTDGPALSLIAEFDELIRSLRNCTNLSVEDPFARCVEYILEVVRLRQVAVEESQRIQQQLDRQTHELGDLQHKLAVARVLLDREKKQRTDVEEEANVYLEKLRNVVEIVMKDRSNKASMEALANLNLPTFKKPNAVNIGVTSPPTLHTILEGNTTGSLLSDINYSMSEDDIDTMRNDRNVNTSIWTKHRASTDKAQPVPGEPSPKKKRSSGHRSIEIGSTDTVRATTTLTMSKKGGPIVARSVIESVPRNEPDSKRTPLKATNRFAGDLSPSTPRRQPAETGGTMRPHDFQSKTVVMPEVCSACDKRIRFAKNIFKCKSCRALCHVECKDKLPLPCVPSANTPNCKLSQGVIGDYTPTVPPMVPSIIIHCLKQVEAKGLEEIGIYRISGSEREVKLLKERFLKGKGAPCLKQIDIHTICSTVKDFLRSLSEPLVSRTLWHEFVKAVELENYGDAERHLYGVISKLPQPNRDTLAFLILHLKKVAEAKECKMPIDNLAKIFAPTVIGYSMKEMDQGQLLTETGQQFIVMQKLLNLPTDYWISFLQVEENVVPKTGLQQTPSTDSLLKPTPKRVGIPKFSSESSSKKRKILPTYNRF